MKHIVKRSELKSSIKSIVREAISDKMKGGGIPQGKLSSLFGKDKGKMNLPPKGGTKLPSMLKKEGLDQKDEVLTKMLAILEWVVQNLEQSPEDAKKAIGIVVSSLNQLRDGSPVNENGPQYKVVSPCQCRCVKCNHAFEVQQDPKLTEEAEPKPEAEPKSSKQDGTLKKIALALKKLADKVHVAPPDEVKQILMDLAVYLEKATGLAEASYKKVSPNQTDTAEEDKARTIQDDPEVNEGNPNYETCSGCSRLVKKGEECSRCKETGRETSRRDREEKDENEPKIRENHKVQTRSYTDANDSPQDPENVRDPEVPMA